MSGEGLITASASSAEINAQLASLKGDPRAYQKLANKLAREILKFSRGRIRAQRGLDGAPFAPRANRRDKRKMLMGLGKKMTVISRAGQSGGAVVSWRDSRMAYTAAGQQHGAEQDWSRLKAQRAYGAPDYNAPCTAAQAKALIKAGYRISVPAAGKKRSLKKVPARWLQEHLTLGQAAIILRLMRTGKAKGKEAWKTRQQPRQFLGVTEADVENLRNQMVQAMLNKI